MKKQTKKKIIGSILRFRFELFITPLFIVMLILSFIYIGFTDFRNIIFNVMLIIEVPLAFYGIKFARQMLYKVYIGKAIDYED